MAYYHGPLITSTSLFVVDLILCPFFCLGDPVDPSFLIHSASSNVICSVLFGERFEYKDEMHKLIINSFKENAQVANGAWAAVS